MRHGGFARTGSCCRMEFRCTHTRAACTTTMSIHNIFNPIISRKYIRSEFALESGMSASPLVSWLNITYRCLDFVRN